MIRRAVLYVPAPDDAQAALLDVAARPVAFRILVAAIRAGIEHIDVPDAWRGTALERAIAASPSATRAVRWLKDGAPPVERVLWLPATLTVPASALARLAAAPFVAALGEPDGDPAPVVAADLALTASLWGELLTGAPLGDALARALKARGILGPSMAGVVRVRGAADAAQAEAVLYSGLGSAIDSPLDTAFHRRLSKPVSRRAVALGVSPNQISTASLLLGLAGAWCIAGGTPAGAVAGLALYAASVVLDHADGEVARLALAESRIGEWLDVTVDTVVHAAVVLAMGVATQATQGGPATLVGGVAALGIVMSAMTAKISPPAAGNSVGRLLQGLGTRDGFYGMLLLFITVLGLQPTALPELMIVVALGAHAYWLSRLAYRLISR